MEQFSQAVLYGDNTDEMLGFLSQEILTLDGTFEKLVHQHIVNTVDKKQCQLPSLGKGFQWLNTKRSLCLDDDLGKKVFVIDFFTYCCINCTHILPYLKEIETKYASNPGFAVIGIHSAKFPNEKDLKQVKEAVLRNNILHPVLNDPDCVLWRTFGIVCWPTVFIVGPGRNLLFVLIGETQIEKLSFLCDQVLKYHEASSFELDTRVLPIFQEQETALFSELLYPGNVSTNGKDILVSDTGHHRLLLFSRDLSVKEIIGSGKMGFDDGLFKDASFNSPHGTTWVNDYLFVADTGNHSIRRVCFKHKIVVTIFRGTDVKAKFGVNNELAKFHSPWDICTAYRLGKVSIFKTDYSSLYIAVAGSHQIWVLNLEKANCMHEDFCIPFAGSGKEENRPNRYRFRSGFAQPSGISYDHNLMPHNLFVADSESSTIKVISLINGEVKNVVGGGLDPTDLFQFGDADGRDRNVKLQHPLSVCAVDSRNLIVADTYNHKIKIVDAFDGKSQTVAINGLNEPSSVCFLDNHVIIADTNNHRIVTIPVNEIMLKIIPEKFDLDVTSYNTSPKEEAKTVLVAARDAHIFCYFSHTPDECKYAINKSAPQKLDLSFKGNKLDALYRCEKFFGTVPQPSLILKQSQNLDEEPNQPIEVTIAISLAVCENVRGTCSFKKVFFKILLCEETGGAKTVHLNLHLKSDCKLFD